ncbi:MAG: hypothetical protein ACLP9D_12780 [Candidatus Bathyarchaeia archaeon]
MRNKSSKICEMDNNPERETVDRYSMQNKIRTKRTLGITHVVTA